MKKWLSILLIMCISILSYFYSQNSLMSVVANVCMDFEIVEENETQVLKLDSVNYEKIIDVLDLEIVNIDTISNRTIIEGYSSKLSDYRVINNRKINIQISCFDNQLIVGYPLIINSF